ncbi:MAG TPA: preprotein translocase subunit YajC [Dehalococcoidia bacterium]|nr:preprotein translocase subunit YajC [Dehalococcoidia bacterium]
MSAGFQAMLSTIVFTVFVVAAFYYILLRPVLQQQRRQRRELSQLQVGDTVLTQAGFIANVKEIRMPPEGPVEIVLDLGRGVEVRAVPTAISQRLQPAGHQEAEGARSRSPEPDDPVKVSEDE